MKKILVGKSGSGKSKACFEIAKSYDGTVVYLNNIVNAEKYYAPYGLYENYIVGHYEKTLHLENNKKYFISPEPSKEPDTVILPERKRLFKKPIPAVTWPAHPYVLPSNEAVLLFAQGKENDYVRNINTSLLLVMDDGYWESSQEDRALLLWQLSHSDRDIVITVTEPDDLVNSTLTAEMLEDLSRYWEVEFLQ